MKNTKTLSELEAKELRKYCKGCRFFKPELPTKNICNLVARIDRVEAQEFMDSVRGCPCNKKCLVKASCREVRCPIWLEYVNDVFDRKGC